MGGDFMWFLTCARERRLSRRKKSAGGEELLKVVGRRHQPEKIGNNNKCSYWSEEYVHCVVEIRITYLGDCSSSTELPFYHLMISFS